MSFFDKLLDPKNNIVRQSGEIRQCMEDNVDGFYIEDHLKAVSIILYII